MLSTAAGRTHVINSGPFESTERLTLGRMWMLVLLLVLLIGTPRALALNRFVTADEHAWLTRSGNFYRALIQGNFEETFQRHHPGVTVTWAGTLGFLYRYPRYAFEAPRAFGYLTEEIEPFLREHGRDPLALLAAGRGFLILGITLTLLASFRAASKLLGLWPALLGCGLVALAPFHIGLSRLLHLDGLVSTLMLLSVLAFIVYRCSGTGRWLFVSAIAAGLAWLTRSPSFFLVPFVALLSAFVPFSASPSGEKRAKITHIIRSLLIWGSVAAITFVALWPAMWVDPVESLQKVLSAATTYAAEGHSKPIFFNGNIYSRDPGWTFYPLAFLWRVTPITLAGLGLALIWIAGSALPLRRVAAQQEQRRAVLILVIYALLFGLFMNLGGKKFDRYLLPAMLPLEFVSGWGWFQAIRYLGQRIFRLNLNVVAPVLSLGIIGFQATFAFPHHPYYLSYYNPLMGGAAKAPQVMQIGWGEGADRAAAALTKQQNAERLQVASAYTNGPFSYFFPGTTLPIYYWYEADYAVVYAQDFQRRLPAPRQIRAFEEMTPMHTVVINGLTYARVYALRNASLPAFVTDWSAENETHQAEPQIRLISYLLTSGTVLPGEQLPVTLYLRGMSPIAVNLSLLVRLTAPDGTELARSEGWPWGSPTSTLQPGNIWPDGHVLLVPQDANPGPYRLDVSFYDSVAQQRWPASKPATGESLGDNLALDFVYVGGDSHSVPFQPLELPLVFGRFVELQAKRWLNVDGKLSALDAITAAPGDELTVELKWHVREHTDVNHTVFVHVVGPDGKLLTQQDQQPWSGFYPTSLWSKGRTLQQPVQLHVPADSAPGLYTVHVGMYDSQTVERLFIYRDGESVGDAFLIDELHVKVEGER